MIKMTLYPKTTRIGNPTFQVVEKLDGSNIGFFMLNGDVVIAQRNYVFLLSEIEENKGLLYKGLYKFLQEHGESLKEDLYGEGSGFFAEWIGMGKIKYGDSLDKKLYMFAKANIKGSYEDKTLEIYNLHWRRDLLMYPFKNQTIPDYIALPKLVATTSSVSIEELDKIYDIYVEEVGRKVEGFVIMSQSGQITKYVRYKNNKETEHQLPK